MKTFSWMISSFLLVFLLTAGIASARVSFRLFLPPVVIGPPAVAAPSPPYDPSPYGYYGYRPSPDRVWVPGYWDTVWTNHGWARVWHPGYWEYRP